MKKVEQNQGESRKEYLVRVAIELLTDLPDYTDTIFYDEAECDCLCLAEDLRIEFFNQ